MNKSVLMAGAFIALAGAAQAADDMGLKPYVGVDLVRTWADYENDPTLGVNTNDLFKDKVDGISPYVGLQINKHVGVELSYLGTEDAKKSDVLGSGVDSKVRITGIAADVVGTLPVSADGRFAVLGSAGIGRFKGRMSATDGSTTVSADDSDVGYRLGVGAQYQFTDNWGVRAMMRYTKVDFEDTVNNLVTGSVGVNYKF